MSTSSRVWILAGILIIATFLRFHHFASTPPGLYPDEAMDGNNAVEAVQTGHLRVYYPEDNGREGLYVNIIAVILKVWPVYEPWVIRLPAAVAGVATVLVMYFLVSELFGYEIGLMAAFLLATSFWHIDFSRIGFRAILAPLLLAWALYLFTRAIRKGSIRELPPSSPWYISPYFYAAIAGIVYGLGFYTYIAYRITPLLFLLFIPFYRKNPGFWKWTIVFVAATFIIAAPIGYYYAQHPADFFGRTSEISVTNSGNPTMDFAANLGKELAMFNFRGDDNWRHNLSGAPELFWPVGILFVFGIILGVYALVKKSKRSTPKSIASLPPFGLWLMFLWFIFAILPAAASDEGIPHALRSILMLPPAIVFASIAGVWLYGIIKEYGSKRAAKFLMAAFLIVVAWFGYYEYFILWAENPNVAGAFNENYVQIGREINALPASTPKYVIVTAGGVLARGIPVPAETTMFITDSFTTQDQMTHNIHYLLPDQADTVPVGTPSNEIFYIE
ncbi:MAG TPA: glycosyltransferase family 39 protein [Candidatus Paceibacterota bacterium]|nr:glycosyltransferase family 39 protein [Candidatus Paceibacterota bacterium]